MLKSRMMGNPLVRFCEGRGGNLLGAPRLLDPARERWVKSNRGIQAPEGAKDQPRFDLTEGKAEAKGHRLPVVATGLIPRIYRRAFFKHRATPIVIAPNEEP